MQGPCCPRGVLSHGVPGKFRHPAIRLTAGAGRRRASGNLHKEAPFCGPPEPDLPVVEAGAESSCHGTST